MNREDSSHSNYDSDSTTDNESNNQRDNITLRLIRITENANAALKISNQNYKKLKEKIKSMKERLDNTVNKYEEKIKNLNEKIENISAENKTLKVNLDENSEIVSMHEKTIVNLKKMVVKNKSSIAGHDKNIIQNKESISAQDEKINTNKKQQEENTRAHNIVAKSFIYSTHKHSYAFDFKKVKDEIVEKTASVNPLPSFFTPNKITDTDCYQYHLDRLNKGEHISKKM